MSLITEALQLRTATPRGRVSGGESFSPLRRRTPAAKVILLVVGLCLGGVGLFWKGGWALERLEGLAGIRWSTPAAVAVQAKTPTVPTAPPSAEPVSPPVTGPVAQAASSAAEAVPSAAREAASAAVAVREEKKPAAVSEELQPMDVNLTLALIEDEKARQQLDEENQRKIESFLRRMDIQGVCHQGENSTALLDSILVRPGDAVGDLGLTLKMIEPRRMVFADRSGREYTKSY